jgi:hypothetical protein
MEMNMPVNDDPLVEAYKAQFPGISDEGAQIQAALNRFAASKPPGWKRTKIGPNAYLLEGDDQ